MGWWNANAPGRIWRPASIQSLHDTLDELRMPRASALRLHLSLLEFVSNAAQRIAALLEVPNERCKLFGTRLPWELEIANSLVTK